MVGGEGIYGGAPYNLEKILTLMRTQKCTIDIGHEPYYDRSGSFFYCYVGFDSMYYELNDDQLDELMTHMAEAFWLE